MPRSIPRAFFVISAILVVFQPIRAQPVRLSPSAITFDRTPIGSFNVQQLLLVNTSDIDLTCRFVPDYDRQHFRVGTCIQEAKAARDVMYRLANTVKYYRLCWGDDPHSVIALTEVEDIYIDGFVDRLWTFDFIGSDPIGQITATSKAELPDGAGRVIIYNIESEEFSGYSIDVDSIEIELQRNQTDSTRISFAPENVIDYNDTLEIYLSELGESRETLLLPVSGTGIEPQPPQFIQPSTDTLNFASTAIGDSSDLDLTLTNISNGWDWAVFVQSSNLMHFRVFDPDIIQVHDTILRILQAAIAYRNDHGRDPEDVEQLITEHYIQFDAQILNKWEFSLIGSNPISKIEAVSQREFHEGAGHVVIYSVQLRQFMGYGFAFYNDNFPSNVYSFCFRTSGIPADGVDTLIIRFLPDEARDYNEELTVSLWTEDRIFEKCTIKLRGTGVPLSANSSTSSPQPSIYFLLPPYPNPFNSTTIIAFDLPRTSPVSIRVYDLSGRSIATLVDGYMKVGQHTTVWNAARIPSGLYTVKMNVPVFSVARNALLVK
jgi:hypothetical protein